MSLGESLKDLAHSLHPIIWFTLITIVVVGAVLYQSGQLTPQNKFILFMIALFGLYLAYRNRERKLIGINEAKRLTYKETIKMQREGELPEGSIIRAPEATLQRIDGQPQHYVVASYVDTSRPFFIVAFLHPYKVEEHLQIEKIKKIGLFDIESIPDYKILVPPDILQYVQFKKSMEDKYGTEVG